MYKNKKIIVLLIVLVVVLAAALAFKFIMDKKKLKNENKNPITRSALQEGQSPQNLPSNLPMEENAKIVQNENVQIENLGDMVKQGRRQYVSEKTLNENLVLYQKYLKDNGWFITNVLDLPEIKSIAAQKVLEGLTLSINITKTDGEKSLVNIVVEAKK